MKKYILLTIVLIFIGCTARKPADNKQIKNNAYKSFNSLETQQK